MAQTFNMPKYGMTMEEGKVLAWRKREGQAVRKGDLLLEIEADKSTVEVESDLAGILLRILAPEGDVVPCGAPLCWIGQQGDAIVRIKKS